MLGIYNILVNCEFEKEVFMKLMQKILNELCEIKKSILKNGYEREKGNKICDFCPFEYFRKTVGLLKNQKILLFEHFFANISEETLKKYEEILQTNLTSCTNNNSLIQIRRIVHVKRKK